MNNPCNDCEKKVAVLFTINVKSTLTGNNQKQKRKTTEYTRSGLTEKAICIKYSIATTREERGIKMIVFNYEKYCNCPVVQKVQKSFDDEFLRLKNNQMKELDGREVIMSEVYPEAGYVLNTSQMVYKEWCDVVEDTKSSTTPLWVMLPIVFVGLALWSYGVAMCIIDRVAM